MVITVVTTGVSVLLLFLLCLLLLFFLRKRRRKSRRSRHKKTEGLKTFNLLGEEKSYEMQPASGSKSQMYSRATDPEEVTEQTKQLTFLSSKSSTDVSTSTFGHGDASPPHRKDSTEVISKWKRSSNSEHKEGPSKSLLLYNSDSDSDSAEARRGRGHPDKPGKVSTTCKGPSKSLLMYDTDTDTDDETRSKVTDLIDIQLDRATRRRSLALRVERAFSSPLKMAAMPSLTKQKPLCDG